MYNKKHLFLYFDNFDLFLTAKSYVFSFHFCFHEFGWSKNPLITFWDNSLLCLYKYQFWYIWWTQIGIHWRHYLKLQIYFRVFSYRHPFQIFRYMVDLLVRDRPYVSDVIGRRFEKVRNDHRFENWMPIWWFEKRTLFWGINVCDVEIRHGFEDWTSIRGWTSIWVLHVY